MAGEAISLFVLAGEASGDRIGGALIRRLGAAAPLKLSGVGGQAMLAEGLRPLFPMSDLSVMGFADVLARLPKLYWRMRQAARAVLAERPDIVVLIDAQVFSATLARRLRKQGYRGPILLYVGPAVWAWKPERAPGLKPLFDEILAVLPFEPAAMARLGGPPTHYVGHPALAQFPFRPAVPARGPLLLLPGSRDGEIARTLPMLRRVAEALAAHPRVTSFVLPTPKLQRARLAAATANWPVPVEIVADEPAKLAAFAEAVAAVAVSGTITLELALAGVPMVVTYVADAGQAKRFLKYKVKFVALPNIVLDRDVVPELLFVEPDPERLAAAALQLLDDRAAAEAQLAGFCEIRTLMEQGAPEAPLEDPAGRVMAMLGR
ncbi:MAG: lipid-A-disaccharide synthase [Devosia sp.]|nr:lipid-A-disaccharide synthase [Devosia sp.]